MRKLSTLSSGIAHRVVSVVIGASILCGPLGWFAGANAAGPNAAGPNAASPNATGGQANAQASQSAAVAKVNDQAFLQAMQKAQVGKLSDVELRAFKGHVLESYLQFYRLQKNYPLLPAKELQVWLEKHQADLPLAPMLRHSVQAHYARKKDWTSLLQTYREAEATPAEKCWVWQARMSLKPDQSMARKHALKLYENFDATDVACQPAFDLLRADLVDADLAQRRFEALIAARKLSAAKAMLQDLPTDQQSLAAARILAEIDAYASLKQHARYPKDAAHRALQVRALQRIASVNPQGALKLLATYQKPLNFDQRAIHTVQAEAARVAIIANDGFAESLLDSVPYELLDPQALEWGVRRALKAKNFRLALKRLEGLPAAQLQTARWAYQRGRLHEVLGDRKAASANFQIATTEPTFYGFLAADRLAQNYSVCPDASAFQPKISSPLLQSLALKRIDKLKALNLSVHAKREWMFLINRLDAQNRRQAGLLAAQLGWGEYAILALNQAPDRLLYHARFPMLEIDLLQKHAKKNGLDAPFVAGLIRQESAWNPSAQSHAKAQGLMQMLSSTAAITAKQIGLTGPIDLFNPKTNITLGTAHLSHLAEKYQNSPILMTAAYNAGPSRVVQWRDALYEKYPDLWIETIPFKETREYVTAVLAFSVIYDHRFDGKLKRLSSRVPEFPQVAGEDPQFCAGMAISETPSKAGSAIKTQ